MRAVTLFLGIDGGDTETAYALIDSEGKIRASHLGGSIDPHSAGTDGAAQLAAGVHAASFKAGMEASSVAFAFLGLSSHGEDSASTSRLDSLAATALEHGRYRCGHAMVCGWAGSLGGQDGVSIAARGGSAAYGEYEGRSARAGGWGELIGGEGSAYWIAREGANLFFRMSDGRAPRGPLYGLVRERLAVRDDLDLRARILGEGAGRHGAFSQFLPLAHDAAKAGDALAGDIFRRAAEELIRCAQAARRSLAVPDFVRLPVSHSGAVFTQAPLLREAFRAGLQNADPPAEYRAPRYPPAVGAALYAARLAGQPLKAAALNTLRLQGDAALAG